MGDEHFNYFGYGSNLLKERLQLMNPSAEFVDIGKLRDYRLDFNNNCIPWKGATATVTPAKGHHVWGVVWRMHETDIPNIDRQEDVHNGTYRAIQVIVETPGGQLVNCLSYELLKLSAKDLRPSPQYMDVILRGARKNGLPKDYVATLETIETNGYSGEMETYNDVLKLLGEKS